MLQCKASPPIFGVQLTSATNKSLPNVLVRAFVCFLFVLFATKLFTFPANAFADSDITEPALELRLDAYLSMNDKEAATAELTDILASINPDEYPSTYVRARTYQAFERAEQSNIEGAIAIVASMSEFIERHPYPDVVSEVQANLVALHWFNRETAKALIIAEQLIESLENANNPRIRYYANSVMVGIFRANSQYERALERGVAALEALSETNDDRTELRRISLTRDIVTIHADLRNYDEALAMVKRNVADAIRIELNDSIPGLLLQQGYVEAQMDLQDDSIATHRRAIEWSNRLGNEDVALISMNNIGSTYIQMERYDEARVILREALSYLDIEGETQNPMAYLLHFNLGYIDVFQGETERGIELVDASYAQLIETYSPSEKADLLDYLARAYARAGLYQQQAEALIEQRDLRAEIFRSDRERSLAELQTRYEAQDQLQQIQLLEQRNALQERVIENKRLQTQIFILFGIVVIFGLILVVIMYRAARKANSKLKVANKQLEFHSLRDPLTALLNRRAIQEKMAKRSPTERRASNNAYPDALILLDVDYFKRINDNLGHAAGDAVLKVLSERLLAVSRATDMVVRWGGEEFLIFLNNMNPEKLPELTKRVLTIIAETPIEFEGQIIPVSATAGFISLPFADVSEAELNWEKALQIADMALYIGKVHGRNRAYGITGLKAPFAEVKQYLDNDLAEAIERDLVEYVLIEGPQFDREY